MRLRGPHGEPGVEIGVVVQPLKTIVSPSSLPTPAWWCIPDARAPLPFRAQASLWLSSTHFTEGTIKAQRGQAGQGSVSGAVPSGPARFHLLEPGGRECAGVWRRPRAHVSAAPATPAPAAAAGGPSLRRRAFHLRIFHAGLGWRRAVCGPIKAAVCCIRLAGGRRPGGAPGRRGVGAARRSPRSSTETFAFCKPGPGLDKPEQGKLGPGLG